jgi:hypothetical protein
MAYLFDSAEEGNQKPRFKGFRRIAAAQHTVEGAAAWIMLHRT